MNRFVLFFIMLIAYNYLSKNKIMDERKKVQLFLILISVPFILDSAMRNLGMGQDTFQYYQLFDQTKGMSFRFLFNSISLGGKDYFFYLFMKSFQLISNRYHIFLGLVAFIYFLSMGLYIYKSGLSLIHCLIAYTFYLQFFYNSFSCTGTRQTLSVAFVTIAYIALMYRKKVIFVVLTIIAVLIHLSAIVAFIMLFILNFKKLGYIVFLIPFGLPFLFMFGSEISKFFVYDTFLSDRYAAYTSTASDTGSVYITMVYLVVFTGMVIYYNDLAKDEKLGFNMKLYTICILLLPLLYVSNTAHRIALFFSMSMYVLIPMIIKNIRFQGRYVITLLIILSLTFVVVRKSRPYHFYWEEMEYVNYYGEHIVTVEPLY